MGLFYAYEFWRPDKDLCFYVGKGSGHRAHVNRRYYNDDFMDIFDELAACGMCAEVRLIAGGLSETKALDLECQRIAFWQSAGVPLVNRTAGGLGTKGYRHSARTREKMSRAKKGKPIHSEETRERIRQAGLGRKASPETRAKMSASHMGNTTGRFLKGRKRSPETCAKMSAARKGEVKSPEWRRAISAGLKRRNASRKKSSDQLVLL
jgi:hypothetical protein